jgi:hypothetical protein
MYRPSEALARSRQRPSSVSAFPPEAATTVVCAAPEEMALSWGADNEGTVRAAKKRATAAAIHMTDMLRFTFRLLLDITEPPASSGCIPALGEVVL